MVMVVQISRKNRQYLRKFKIYLTVKTLEILTQNFISLHNIM